MQLSDVDIEAVRLIVDEASDIAGWKIRRVAKKLKRGSIIGVIVRQGRMIIPDGETTIESGDHVIVITYHKNLSAMSKLFRPRR